VAWKVHTEQPSIICQPGRTLNPIRDDEPAVFFAAKMNKLCQLQLALKKESSVDNSIQSLSGNSCFDTREIPNTDWPGYLSVVPDGDRKDHFVEKNGIVYAGKHLILDLWGACELDNLALMEQTLRDCVCLAKATLLHIHLHHFSPNGGISGVAVLAESHISVHTWPERDFAAFDIFMCGNARPARAIPVINAAFKPESIEIHKILRGK